MKIFRGHESITNPWSASVLVLGIFDGLHLGHQQLLALAQKLSQKASLMLGIYTFHPNPQTLFNPQQAPLPIECLAKRLLRLKSWHCQNVIVQPFHPRFAALEAEDFAKNILFSKLQARHIVIGEDFSFGHKRLGNVQRLKAWGQQQNVQIHAVTHSLWQNERISSTRLRHCLQNTGDVAAFEAMTGKAYTIKGLVVHGDGRGKLLQSPTANVQCHFPQLLPRHGVYAGIAFLHHKKYVMVMNIGKHPTIAESSYTKIEAHFIDYPGDDFYGENIQLQLLHFLRSEQKFASLQLLQKQIALDIQQAKSLVVIPQ